MAWRSVSSPEPVNPTSMMVVALLLCRIAVMSAPAPSPSTRFLVTDARA
jgi:hypothetical protein